MVEIKKKLLVIFGQAGIQAEVSARPKHIYSIYRKMVRKGVAFDQVHDVRGVRIIVPDITSCYTALGLIHNRWRPIPGEFDDYIAAPKDNFYRSLHTAVVYDDGLTWRFRYARRRCTRMLNTALQPTGAIKKAAHTTMTMSGASCGFAP